MRVDTRSGAFNGRRSGARLAPAVLTPRRRWDLDKHPQDHFMGSRRYRAIKLASRGGECESVAYSENTHDGRKRFAFNRRQLLVP